MSMVAFLAQTLRIAIPYLLAAAGGVLSERAGLIGLTLEGYMLGGAFCAAVGSYAAGAPWVGVLAAVVGGGLLALLYATSAIRFKADQVVVGIAINLLAIGLTRFFLRLIFDSSSNSPRVPGFGATGGGTGFGALVQNPLVWVGVLVIPLVGWVLYRTPFGLRVRAVGEHPSAAASVGVPVNRVRYLAVALSGMIAGLGGAYLALDQHQFTGAKSSPEYPDVQSKLAVKIVHAANHRAFKGSDFLASAVSELRQQGLAVELVLVENLPNEIALGHYRSADIIFDQCLIGFHGYFALEGMALGKPVMSFVRFPDRYLLAPNECPIVNTSLLTLKHDIAKLCADRVHLRDLGVSGRRYVEKYFSIEAVSRRMSIAYKALGV